MIDIQAPSNSKREHIWKKVRKTRVFSVNDLQTQLPSSISKDCVRDYLMRLCAGGYMERNDSVKPILYTLIKDCGIDAPRLRTNGSVVTLGIANENMWRTAKILKIFDWRDLMIAASTEQVKITQKTARAYVEALHQASYLTCVRQSVPGTRAVYRFNSHKNTGVRAPKIKRDKSLYDPNLGKIVYQRGD